MMILETANLRKEYGTLVAVREVSFSLDRGQVLGLIGPNGAGKTTLLRMLATLLPPTRGTASVLGCDLKQDYLAIRRRVGYLPDFFNLYSDLTLRECLSFFASAYGCAPAEIPGRVNQVLDYIDLQDKRDNFIRHLSRGMVQRLGVGAMIVHAPDLFLLDEPASGLDPKARIQLRNVLRRLSAAGHTIIISSHILTELSGFCSHLAIMDQGKLVRYGEVEQIQRQFAGARKLSVTVLEESDQAAALIRAFPNAVVTEVRENAISAELAAGPDQLAALNAHLVTQGIKVTGFFEEQTSLEDLFMKISSGTDHV